MEHRFLYHSERQFLKIRVVIAEPRLEECHLKAIMRLSQPFQLRATLLLSLLLLAPTPLQVLSSSSPSWSRCPEQPWGQLLGAVPGGSSWGQPGSTESGLFLQLLTRRVDVRHTIMAGRRERRGPLRKPQQDPPRPSAGGCPPIPDVASRGQQQPGEGRRPGLPRARWCHHAGSRFLRKT